MKKPKLKYDLQVVGTCVLFQILFMDARFRATTKRNMFRASNGLLVISDDRPELGTASIHLWGQKDKYDYRIVQINCVKRPVAVAFAAQVHSALADWSDNWKGFKQFDAEEPQVFEV